MAAAVVFFGIGDAPFIDPPEGFHARIASEMGGAGGWITPRLNAVRYFDKPPVPYWLMAASFAVAGPTPAAARVWGALAAVGVAIATAVIGARLGGPRLGVLAGTMSVANLGIFVYARIVKPDLPFVLFITLAWLGVVLAWQGSRAWLALVYAALGLAAITKDMLGAVGPLVVLALGLWWTDERPMRRWFPWWGIAILVAVAVPWYLTVEIENRGFLWYTVVDNKLLNVARTRQFPDEDVPLGALEFLVLGSAAFLPWTLAAAPGAVSALRDDRAPAASAPLWRLLALWALGVVVAFTVSPFRLPHYGLPAFPALALLAARAWDDALATPERAARVAVPAAVAFAVLASAFGAMATGLVTFGDAPLVAVDVASRNLAARGQAVPAVSGETWRSMLLVATAIFATATLVLAAGAWRRVPRVAAIGAVAAMAAFLPVAGRGTAEFARLRSSRTVIDALACRAGPSDVVAHEGALENSGSLLLALDRPVRVVNGLRSNLAYGATFPDSRDLFWDEARLAQEWPRAGPRRFLVSVVAPDKSVVRALPPERVHLLAHTATHWLYSNLADGESGRR